jgi:hypothetical protein
MKKNRFKKDKNGLLFDDFGYLLPIKHRAKFEVKEWLMGIDTKNCMAITLSIKQGDKDQFLTKEICRQNLKHFLNVMNAYYFGNNYKRRSRRLKVIPSLETSAKNNRLHYHLLLENPDSSKNKGDFETKVRRTWWNTHWGDNEVLIKSNVDKGWIDYITKFKKNSDEIDWCNYNH